MSQHHKPKQIMLSKRANIFYLDRVRIMQKDERLVYLAQSGADIQQYFNIPERNTAVLLLGKGSSITDAAARKLAESNVVVGFCGSGGTPIFSSVDYCFLVPHSEYGPTEYMQAWAKKWFDDEKRLSMARSLIQTRIEYCQATWAKNSALVMKGINLPDRIGERFSTYATSATSAQDILLAEAQWAKSLYAVLAKGFGFDFSRRPSEAKTESGQEKTNSFLDHGNYLAYGLSAVALNGLGISYCFPLLHGKTRRGALVFDVADLVKDAVVMPLAFEMGKSAKTKDKDFRSALIETMNDHGVLDFIFQTVKRIAEEN